MSGAMPKPQQPATTAPSTDEEVIRWVSDFVSTQTGIQLGPKQIAMVESRLKKRLFELRLSQLHDYHSYFLKNEQEESQNLISLITTHHSYFFREFAHFEFLESTALPALLPVVRQRPDKTLRIWSAACSRGQEAYSLAMLLHNVLKAHAPEVKFEILGTDVDRQSITIAKNAVYRRTEIKEVPTLYLADHWARGSGEIADFVKAKKSLTQNCRFDFANLLELPASVTSIKFDLIFCRNVYIYFNHAQIQTISRKIAEILHPEGYLFIGLSESLHGLDVPLKIKGPSIYQLIQGPKHSAISAPLASRQTDKPTLVQQNPSPQRVEIPNPLRVFAVDDSGTILTLLKQILKKENGFELIGTAQNGREAAEKIPALKPDAITLDIHMPEVDGIQYLERHFGPSHPPVVMLTSVSRENCDLAIKALHLGASDYVEKPAFSHLEERGDEIRMKLRCAYRNKLLSASSKAVGEALSKAIELDEQFKTRETPRSLEKTLVLMIGHLSDASKMQRTIAEWGPHRPPSIILFDGIGESVDLMAAQLRKQFSLPIEPLREQQEVSPGELRIADLKQNFEVLQKAYAKRNVIILLFGEGTRKAKNFASSWRDAVMIVEDLEQNRDLKTQAKDLVPYTSFSYMSLHFLSSQEKKR